MTANSVRTGAAGVVGLSLFQLLDGAEAVPRQLAVAGELLGVERQRRLAVYRCLIRANGISAVLWPVIGHSSRL